MLMAGEPELDAALETIQKGCTSVNLNAVGYMDDALTKTLADAIASQDVPIAWDFVHAQREEDGFSKRGGEEAEEVEYGSAVSRLPNVLSFTVRMNRYGRYAYVGLTTDPSDDYTFQHGHGVKMSPAGLSRASGPPLSDSSFAPTEDLICVALRTGEVAVHKNGALLEVLGPAPIGHVALYAKIFMREPDLLLKMSATATCSKVTSIELSRNKIGDKGAQCLAEVLERETNLVTSLDLSLNRVCDDGAVRIAKALQAESSGVTVLNLSHNVVSDGGAAGLAEALEHDSCRVTSIDLTDNDIGDEGAIRLAEALGQESCLVTSIKLGLNRIESAGIVSLAEALEKRTCKVTSIALGHNMPDKQAKKRLAKAYAKTLRLDVT